MKSYVVFNELLNRDVEIFRLDDYGNLTIFGNLTLGTNGVLTAAALNVPSTAEMEIVRDPIEMEVPFTKQGSAIYYLGPSVKAGDPYTKDGNTYYYSQDYTYGAWFEKYVYGYDCVIDTASITSPDFVAPVTSFRALSEGTYAHNKAMLDAYPSTVKMVLTAVAADPEDAEDEGHWEIKYYDVDNELLYNDTLSVYLLDHSDYNFPFTPLNANLYEASDADIPISVTTVYAVREINPVDFTLYAPLAGKFAFESWVKTQDLIPDPGENNKYRKDDKSIFSIGSSDNRYFRGYFNELYADVLNASSLNLEYLNVDSFGLSVGKTNITAGDAIIISDSEDDGALKKALGATFNGDTTKFLRQDGTFAAPVVVIPEITSIDDAGIVAGTMLHYVGTSDAFYKKGTVYLGTMTGADYQIKITGATFANNNVTNAGIFPVASLNYSSRLITALNALNIGTVASYIETQGYVTLVYNSEDEGWYIDGQKSRGIVPKATTLAGVTNEELIDELITDNSLYETLVASDEEIRITIATFIWKPLNTVQFDGVSTTKYLSQAGTWEDIPESEESGSTPGFHPAEETGEVGSEPYYYVLGSVSMNSTTGQVIVLGVDDLSTPGVYELRGGTSDPDFTICVKNVLNTIYQTITAVRWNEAAKTFIRTVPDRIMRKGTLNTGTGAVAWESWVYVYNTCEVRASLDTPNTWRTPTKAELEYLLSTRTNAASLYGLGTIGSVPGIIILDDYGTLPNITGAHFTAGSASGYATNSYTEAEWNKYYSNLMVFLPCAGKRFGTVVSDTKDKTAPLAAYWTATQAQAYEEGVTDAEAYALKVLAASQTFVGYEHENGLAVRLVKTSSTGVFSVAANRRVIFAKGNLQYHPVNNIYRFAKNQYDTIDEFNMHLDALYDGWVDLFGYGTSGLTGEATQPINISTDPDDYTTEDIESNPDLDWGKLNSIYSVAKPSIVSCLDDEY